MHTTLPHPLPLEMGCMLYDLPVRAPVLVGELLRLPDTDAVWVVRQALATRPNPSVQAVIAAVAGLLGVDPSAGTVPYELSPSESDRWDALAATLLV